MRRLTVLVATLLVVSMAAPAAVTPAAAGEHEYDGKHVSFDIKSNGIAEYSVNNETLFSSVKTQAASEAAVDVGAGVDASAIAGFEGAGLEATSTTTAAARFRTENGAQVAAHDTERGHLTIHATEQRTLVQINMSDPVGTTPKGTLIVVGGAKQVGSVFIVGEGNLSITEEGNIVADLHKGSGLVFRSNGENRTTQDQATERLIERGAAAGEVYVSKRNGEVVADTVQYDTDISVEIAQYEKGFVEVAVNRTTEKGTIVIMEVSKKLIEDPGAASVRVSGTEATRVDTHAELRRSLGKGEPTYKVSQATTSQANAAVLVAIDSFSRQTVVIEERQESTPVEESAPGFGVSAALLAMLTATLAARRYAQ
ncbi:MAG: PGF-CTERM sorting domain-containing protein [Halopenitus sp.]